MEHSNEEKVQKEESTNGSKHHSMNRPLIAVVAIIAVIFVVCGVMMAGKIATGHIFKQNKTMTARNFENSPPMQGKFNCRENIGNKGRKSQITGKLTKIDGDNITLHKDSNEKDYVIIISDTTQIEKNDDIAGKSELQIGQAISVIGSANSSGQINAKIIIIN